MCDWERCGESRVGPTPAGRGSWAGRWARGGLIATHAGIVLPAAGERLNSAAKRVSRLRLGAGAAGVRPGKGAENDRGRLDGGLPPMPPRVAGRPNSSAGISQRPGTTVTTSTIGLRAAFELRRQRASAMAGRVLNDSGQLHRWLWRSNSRKSFHSLALGARHALLLARASCKEQFCIWRSLASVCDAIDSHSASSAACLWLQFTRPEMTRRVSSSPRLSELDRADSDRGVDCCVDPSRSPL